MSVHASQHAPGALAFANSRQAGLIVAPEPGRWTIIDVNDAYLQVTGRARADLLGRALFDAFPENKATSDQHGAGRIADSLHAAMTGERCVLPVQRYDLPRPDDPTGFHEHYWEVSTTPLCGADGDVLALLCEVNNVTDRERLAASLEAQNVQLMDQSLELELTNQQLQENAIELEAQTEALQETALQLEERSIQAERAMRIARHESARVSDILSSVTDAYILLDQEFRVMEANPAAERALGKSRDAMLGRTHWELFPASYDMEAGRAYRAIAAGGPAAHLEQHYAADGYDVRLEIDAYPAADHGVAIFWRDVTRRVRAEQALRERESQLRTLADAIPTLAWTARADGYIEWYNARWYEYTGTMPADMQGWGWQRVHDATTLPEVMAEWTRSIDTGEPFEMTFPLRGADGVFRPFLTRVTSVRDAAGQVTRWFGTNTNVEHEHLARRSAEEANAAKTTFLATMSHELRTPLNALGGYLELLLMELRGPLTTEQRADLERMQRSHRHLLGLINHILNFAKIDTGHAEFDITAVDVATVLRRVEELVSPQCAAKSIACAIEIGDADVHAQADDERVGQILLNLLGNAVKYTPRGGRVVATCAREEDHVVVRIADTGIGIAPDQSAAIFNPFVQVGRRLNAPVEGVGLGLAISRTLAEGMRGTLSVESIVGEGSTFTLRLPAASAN